MTVPLVLLLYAALAALIFVVYRWPRSVLGRELRRGFYIRPRERFEQLHRRDLVRAAGSVGAVGGVLLLVAGGVFALDGRLATLSRASLIVETYAFVTGSLGLLALASSASLGIRALGWRPLESLPFTILAGDEIIGYTALEKHNEEEYLFSGRFIPTPAFASVYPVFRLYRDSIPELSGLPLDLQRLERYFLERGSLGLRVVNRDGAPITTRHIHIADLSFDGGAEHFRVVVGLPDGMRSLNSARHAGRVMSLAVPDSSSADW